jgi:hypothetical protein
MGKNNKDECASKFGKGVGNEITEGDNQSRSEALGRQDMCL